MSTNTYWSTVSSPLGGLLLTSDGNAITRVYLPIDGEAPEPEPEWERADDLPVLAAARRQLEEYFAGTRKEFDLPLGANGTSFQKRVWEELCRIPYGVTISYAELAERIGNPRAVRAVGQANGRNPIAIVVPCHRVIGASGTLVGYGGGLPNKQKLLALEGAAGGTLPMPL